MNRMEAGRWYGAEEWLGELDMRCSWTPNEVFVRHSQAGTGWFCRNTQAAAGHGHVDEQMHRRWQ